MSGFRELFEAYGADYEATMARFMQSEVMYLRFLDMLFQDGNLSKLSDALEAGDTAGAFAAAHTLKGVVGNMGLTPLYEAVCAIVKPLRAGEHRSDYPALFRTIQDEFGKADALRRTLKGGDRA